MNRLGTAGTVPNASSLISFAKETRPWVSLPQGLRVARNPVSLYGDTLELTNGAKKNRGIHYYFGTDKDAALEDWGKLIGDIPSATAILDRFLHRSVLFQITGRSYRLGMSENNSKGAKAPTGSDVDNKVEGKAPKGAKA